MFEKRFTVDLGNKRVNCKTYSLREYLQVIFSKNSHSSDLIKKAYSDIIKNNVEGDGFNKHESELLLLNLILHSEHENEPKLKYVCSCDHEFETIIKPQYIQIDYDKSDINIPYKFTNFSIKFKWPDLWDDDNITLMIAKCIEYIYVGDERIKVSDLSDAELDDLYDAIQPEDIEKIKNILLKPKVVAGVPVKCPKCGKTEVKVLKGFKEIESVI